MQLTWSSCWKVFSDSGFRRTWPQMTPSNSVLEARRLHKTTGHHHLHHHRGWWRNQEQPSATSTSPGMGGFISPSLKQRQSGLTRSAIEVISVLCSPLLTFEWHFLCQECAPQQGIYTWLQHRRAFHQCLLRIPQGGVGRINYLVFAEGFEDKMCQVIIMCFTDLGMYGLFFFFNGLLILLTGNLGQSYISCEVSFLILFLIGFLIAVFTLVTY